MNRNLFLHKVGYLVGYPLLVAWSLLAQAAPFGSQVGLWKMIDDQSGAPRALIRVTESNGEFQGTIEKSVHPGDDENSVWEKCEGSRHGQRLLGMAIVTGMRKQGEVFADGEILDPDNEKFIAAR